ncbi:thioredoxin-dependent peroxidase [Suillus cothurnatus]|nr:thioredoxin-dependent peroxidase [Suillus cothurnatus]
MYISVGDTIPKGTFATIPFTEELADHSVCGIPTNLSTDSWKGKKVVLFSVPGAFTPTSKGVDVIAVIAANDPFVLSGWGRVEGLTDKIITLSDPNAACADFGIRTARYAMIIDDLVIKYVDVESGPGVTVSGADAVLAKL